MSRSRTPRGWWRVLVPLFVLALLAAACGGKEEPSTQGPDDTTADDATGGVPAINEETPEQGGTLVYALAAETNGWDPTTSQWGPWGLTVARTFFDTLTIFDDEGKIHPYLAESFTPNENYDSWVIKLRPNVTFHNGEPLTAAVLKANWDSYTASPLVGRIFEEIASTEVLGDPETSLEMRANLVSRWVNFPEAWTTQIGVVQATESLEADNATRARNPIGTGPFVFDEWVPDQFLRVTRNDDYWQDGLPYLDEIEFRPITDPTSRSAALRSGEVDIAELEEIQELEPFTDDENFTVWKDSRAETAESFVMLNTLQPPLDDLRVRQALAYATDKATVNVAISNGERELANGPYRESSPWYNAVDYPQFDLAKAQQLVEEYEAENGPISFTMEVGAGGAIGAQTAQILQEQWAEAGIEVELGSTEIASLIASVVVGDYTAVVWRQFDSPTPLQETVWWHEEGAPDLGEIGLNFARNRDDVLSEALDTSRTVASDDEEKAQFDIAQTQLAADIPYIWITHIEPAIVAESDIMNVLHAPIPGTDAEMMSFHNSAHELSQVWVQQGN